MVEAYYRLQVSISWSKSTANNLTALMGIIHIEKYCKDTLTWTHTHLY